MEPPGNVSRKRIPRFASISTIKLIFQNYIFKISHLFKFSSSLVEVAKTLLHEKMLTEKGHQDMFYGKESQRMATRFSSISTTKLIFQNDIVKNFSSLRLSSSLVEVAKTLLHEIMWTEKGHQEMFYGKESQRVATRFSSISTIKLIL
jgi:hypothetical protein